MVFKAAELDDSVFNDSNLEAHYWAGLLAADGCLSMKRGSHRDYKTIVLFLANDDGNHTQALLDFIKSSRKLTHSRQSANNKWAKPGDKTTGAMFWSDRTWDWLVSHGIVQRKSSVNMKVSDLLAQSPDFWRGAIDGDGTVKLIKNQGLLYPCIALGGSLALVTQFQDFVHSVGGKRPKIGKCRSISVLAMNGAPAQAIIRVLYERPGPALPRKAKTARECLDWKGRRPQKFGPR